MHASIMLTNTTHGVKTIEVVDRTERETVSG